MLGLAYYYDAVLHAGQGPVEPALDNKAIGAFRQAVLVDETNGAAKTNLELVLRKQLSLKPKPLNHTKPIPDTSRVNIDPGGPNGLPQENGGHGKRFTGGF